MSWNSIFKAVGNIATYALVSPIWIALLFRRVRVSGRKEILPLIKQGNVVLISNHPSLLETIATPALFWPWKTGKHNTQVPYSITDENFFGGVKWLQNSSRCIIVSRNTSKSNRRDMIQKNRQARQQCQQLLKSGGVIIYYPEGGRTCKGKPAYQGRGRTVRSCHTKFLNKIIEGTSGTIVVPIWISHGVTDTPLGIWQGYLRLFRTPLEITFGRPMEPNDQAFDSIQLEKMLLETGQN